MGSMGSQKEILRGGQASMDGSSEQSDWGQPDRGQLGIKAACAGSRGMAQGGMGCVGSEDTEAVAREMQ